MKSPTTGPKKKNAKRREQAAHTRAEVAWFYGELGGRVPEAGLATCEIREAAMAVDAAVQSLVTFHRGALALRFTKRDWPDCIHDHFGEAASLVIRLECALHPAVGRSNEELEQASVTRLSARIAESRFGFDGGAGAELGDLKKRAGTHVRLALSALVRARGDAPCRVPTPAIELEAR